MNESNEEDLILSSFNHLSDYNKQLEILLDDNVTDFRVKESAVYSIGLILEIYQEQSYLLDPYLESMLSRPISSLMHYLKLDNDDINSIKMKRLLSKLIYIFAKTRGYKVISRFFYHNVQDLIVVLKNCERLSNDHQLSFEDWELRYVLLLWLSIAIMIPFELKSMFGEHSDIISRLRNLCCNYLFLHGKEREGAILVLSKAFMRQDLESSLKDFVNWCTNVLSQTTKSSIFIAPSVLNFFCEVLKVSQGSKVTELIAPIESSLSLTKSLAVNNPLLRKYRIKLMSRLCYKIPLNDLSAIDRIEDVVDNLLDHLHDSDTIVRWSSAKHLSRIASKLIDEFKRDIIDAILELFMDGTNIDNINDIVNCDISNVSEFAWHGATISIAEMVRNGAVPYDYLPKLIPVAVKALNFDLRKGAVSVGSNTRDAAAYFFWAMSRTSQTKDYASQLDLIAVNLVLKALFDREVHIRRAASAAFQELVGRSSLVVEGISVLKSIDFFIVGVRRTAFLEAAVEVSEFELYRDAVLTCLVDHVVVHWDFDIRKLGSNSLALICAKFPAKLDCVIDKLIPRMESLDPLILHGCLSSLLQLSKSFANSTDLQIKIFNKLPYLKTWQFSHTRFASVLEVACNLISSISLNEIILSNEKILNKTILNVINMAMGHKSKVVQISGASALGNVSKHVDCTSNIERMCNDYDNTNALMQQSITLTIGFLHFKTMKILQFSIKCLLKSINNQSRPNIEAKVNSFEALSKIIIRYSSNKDLLTDDDIYSILYTLYDGLWDYTTDQRGDVGSWCRVTCIRGLRISLENAITGRNIDEDFINKVINRFVGLTLDNISSNKLIAIDELDIVNLLPIKDSTFCKNVINFINLAKRIKDDDNHFKLFDAISELYRCEHDLRDDILLGLALSINSKNELNCMDSRKVIINLSNQDTLIRVLGLSRRMFKSNFFMGLLNTIWFILLESCDIIDANTLDDIIALTKSYCQKSKIISRIIIGMKIITYIHFHFHWKTEITKQCLLYYLTHPLPRIRAVTSEELFIVAQTELKDCEAFLNKLLEIDWLVCFQNIKSNTYCYE